MTDKGLVLAALAAAKGEAYQPVHIQKFLFIVQEQAKEDTGSPFEFVPWHYGPFCLAVYEVLDDLSEEGLATIMGEPRSPHRSYRATVEGQRQGELALDQMPENIKDYLIRLSEWVRSQTFASLVSAVYRKYPSTAVNSVFHRY